MLGAIAGVIARTDWWLVKAGILAADALLIALLLALLVREPPPRPAEALATARGRWLWRLAFGATVLGILGVGVLFLVALRAEPPK